MVESKCGFYFYLNVSLLVFRSGRSSDDTGFPVSGSFFFNVGSSFCSIIAWPAH